MQESGWGEAVDRLPLYGPEETRKCIEFEQHVVREVIALVKEHDLQGQIELQENGRLHAFYTDSEFEWFENALKTTKEVGGTITGLEYWEKERVQKVCTQ
jgi:hypothetical protein